MQRTSIVSIEALVLTLAVVLLCSGETMAGQLKTLNTAALAVGGQIEAHSSPQNAGNAMEMEVYEWLTAPAPAGGNYRCRILSNSTGRTLNLRDIGLNGTIVGSCAAANGGTCDTPTLPRVGNSKFMCIVATANGDPVTATAHYIIAVQRQ